MQFGKRVRQLREESELPQKELAELLDVSPSSLNTVERERLHFGDYPSAKSIHKLAEEIEADEDELLLLADNVPNALRQRIRERPEVFNAVASLNDKATGKQNVAGLEHELHGKLGRRQEKQPDSVSSHVNSSG